VRDDATDAVERITDIDDDGLVGVKIRAHPSLCQGWGQCHRWAPDVYPLDEHGHIDVHLLDVPPERVHDAELGALVCPERALTVIRPAR
jgi:ferredoxin